MSLPSVHHQTCFARGLRSPASVICLPRMPNAMPHASSPRGSQAVKGVERCAASGLGAWSASPASSHHSRARTAAESQPFRHSSSSSANVSEGGHMSSRPEAAAPGGSAAADGVAAVAAALSQRHSLGTGRPVGAPSSSQRRRSSSVVASAAVTGGRGGAFDAADGQAADFETLCESVARGAVALYRFSRPHTMLGTTISVISISLLALQGCAITSVALTAMATALGSALLMNISIVGINQIFDVDIDKVNKPELPLASGELSMAQAMTIVAACTATSLVVGWLSGSVALMTTLSVSLALGIVYSTDLPFMRWKRSPVLAAGCILAVRALIVQLGFFYHIKFAVGSSLLWLTPPLIFTVGFMFFFSIVIALFKDIPDVKGDDQEGVRTLSVRLGVENVFWICIGLLTTAYACAIGFQAWSLLAPALGTTTPWGTSAAVTAVAGTQSLAWGSGGGLVEMLGEVFGGGVSGLARGSAFMAISNMAGHSAMLAALWQRARSVKLKRKQEIVSFYMFVWKLFYAEYLLIPLLQA